jgi:hypothetical protein
MQGEFTMSTVKYVFMRFTLVGFSAITLSAPIALASKDFSCSPKNNVCIVNDRSVVTGDEVGFFTDRGELIATGKVTKMNGQRRSVQLTQVMGQVDAKAESYATIDTDRQSVKSFRTYRRPAQLVVGSSIGMSTFGAGSDAAGYEASAVAIRSRFLGQLDGYARGSIYMISGTSRAVYADQDAGEFKANALAGSAGFAYNLFSRDDFLVRTEAGVGLAYTMASINGSANAAKSDEWGYGVSSGFGLHARGLLAAGYRFDAFQFEAGVSPAMLAGRPTTTLGVGFLLNLK